MTAVDIDVSGLDDLGDEKRLEVVQADLEASPWPLPGRRFGAVVVTNYLWRPLFPHIIELIDAEGVLLYETFALGNEAYGRPTHPDFLLRPGELIELVRGRLQVAAYEHGYLEQPRPTIRQRICAMRGARPVALGVALPAADLGEGTTMIRDPLVACLIRHGLAGALAGWLTVVGLLALDVGGLGTLAFASDLFPVPLVMLFGFFGLTFASVAMGAAIMSLGRAGPAGGGRARPAGRRGRRSAPALTSAPCGPAARRR